MPSEYCSIWLVGYTHYFFCILLTTFHSAVFQAGGLVVVLVEVFRKAYLASVVPVIVNVILNEHQLVVDIIAFVSKGDFPRSRLGEKQRGKILAGWVTRKMRTIAQFSIRDPDGTDSQVTEVPEDRVSNMSSLRNRDTMMTGSTMAGMNSAQEMSPSGTEQQYNTIPADIKEHATSGEYENSIMPSPPLVPGKIPLDENTPTNSKNGRFQTQYPGQRLTMPTEPTTNMDSGPRGLHVYDPSENIDDTPHAELTGFNYGAASPPPRFDSQPKLELPQIMADEGLGLNENDWQSANQGLSSWKDASHNRQVSGSSGRGGLRALNVSDGDGAVGSGDGRLQRSGSERYDGSGYGM
jgi:hypothetical protein